MVRPVVDGIRARTGVSVRRGRPSGRVPAGDGRRRARLGLRSARARRSPTRSSASSGRGPTSRWSRSSGPGWRSEPRRALRTRGCSRSLEGCRRFAATNVPWPADRPHATTHRTDRISETIREIVATQLTELDDERLELVTVTGVKVDNDLNRADVYYSALMAERDGRPRRVEEGLEEVRWRDPAGREPRDPGPQDARRSSSTPTRCSGPRSTSRTSSKAGSSPRPTRDEPNRRPCAARCRPERHRGRRQGCRLDVPRRRREGAGHPRHPQGRATRARSIPTRPGCWCSASGGPPDCCGS